MDLSVFLGQPISDALESVKKLTGIVEYSKVEGDEFVKAPEMGFYLQSKDGVGVVSAYRIYMDSCDPYFSAPDEVKGEFQGCDDVFDVEKILGQPVRNIPSVKIPGGNNTLRGKMYSWRNFRVMAHFDDGDNLVYLHFKML